MPLQSQVPIAIRKPPSEGQVNVYRMLADVIFLGLQHSCPRAVCIQSFLACMLLGATQQLLVSLCLHRCTTTLLDTIL